MPTIRHYLDIGITRCSVICSRVGCFHSGTVTFERIALSGETILRDIPRYRRFHCTMCGERRVSIEPEWLEYRPPGSGLRI